jgi:hypothetical protein
MPIEWIVQILAGPHPFLNLVKKVEGAYHFWIRSARYVLKFIGLYRHCTSGLLGTRLMSQV